MTFFKRIVNWFSGKTENTFGRCFNCGKELDKNYSPLCYTHAEGETEYGRLCEDCANILDNLEKTAPIEIADDFQNDS